MILNGFRGFYEEMARLYFSSPEAREASRAYYAALLSAARRGDAAAAERVTRNVMARSLDLWREAGRNGTGAASRPRRRARTVGGAG
jgi:GntR family negative regulator for fad regulon and positive regulator of fabA